MTSTEKTLILVKHDGVLRGLVGEVVRRFENVGLKIVGMKMIWADEELAGNHYLISDEWANNVFSKSKSSAEEKGKEFPYKDAKEFASTPFRAVASSSCALANPSRSSKASKMGKASRMPSRAS